MAQIWFCSGISGYLLFSHDLPLPLSITLPISLSTARKHPSNCPLGFLDYLSIYLKWGDIYAIPFKTLRRRVGAAETSPTLKKIYDAYMAPDGHFAAGEQEDALEDAKARNRLERKPCMSFAQNSTICPNNSYSLGKAGVPPRLLSLEETWDRVAPVSPQTAAASLPDPGRS
jgi:hypothetical protein